MVSKKTQRSLASYVDRNWDVAWGGVVFVNCCLPHHSFISKSQLAQIEPTEAMWPGLHLILFILGGPLYREKNPSLRVL